MLDETHAAQAVPVPEPALAQDEMVARATGLREALLERQAECERLGTLPDATQADFLAAGFYRILQPRRYGGYEFDLETFARVMSEVARGCPSSGWVLALTAGHTHTLAHFAESAQVEGFCPDGDFRCPLMGAPGGPAVPVEGGYRLSGTWDYVSGIDTATHYMGTAFVPGEAGAPPEILLALVRREDLTVVDNWDAFGMRGTGSKRIVVEDVFVPHEWTMSRDRADGQPGRGTHANPLYLGPIGSLLFFELTAVAIGVARGALDEYEAILRRRTTSFPPVIPRFESHEFQRPFGDAYGLVDLAEAGLQRAARDYTELCRREAEEGVPFDEIADRRLLLFQQRAVNAAAAAVDLLFRTAGTSAARPDQRLQRYFRDMSLVRTHITMAFERTAENFAKLHFGLPAGPL